MVLAVLSTTTLALTAKPNFSGEWKFNSEKSDFGEFPAPYALTQKIVHEEPSIKVVTSMSTDMGDGDFDADYTTDGEECVNESGEGDVTSTVKWEGDTLIIDSKGSFGGGEFTMHEEWKLAEGGKSYTNNRTMASDMGEVKQTIVMEKQ
jgi:hypothetical protein